MYGQHRAPATSTLRAGAELDREPLGVSAQQLAQPLRLGHLRRRSSTPVAMPAMRGAFSRALIVSESADDTVIPPLKYKLTYGMLTPPPKGLSLRRARKY